MKTKNKILVFLALILALSAGFMGYLARHYQERVANINPYELSVPDANDLPQSLAQWQGKTIVLNFWATWCTPCLAEIPEFIQLQSQLQAQGIQFVGIAIDDKENVMRYLQSIAINYPILIAGNGGIRLSQAFGNIIGAIPFTVIINPTGQILHRQMGELSADALKKILAELQVIKP